MHCLTQWWLFILCMLSILVVSIVCVLDVPVCSLHSVFCVLLSLSLQFAPHYFHFPQCMPFLLYCYSMLPAYQYCTSSVTIPSVFTPVCTHLFTFSSPYLMTRLTRSLAAPAATPRASSACKTCHPTFNFPAKISAWSTTWNLRMPGLLITSLMGGDRRGRSGLGICMGSMQGMVRCRWGSRQSCHSYTRYESRKVYVGYMGLYWLYWLYGLY